MHCLISIETKPPGQLGAEIGITLIIINNNKFDMRSFCHIYIYKLYV